MKNTLAVAMVLFGACVPERDCSDESTTRLEDGGDTTASTAKTTTFSASDSGGSGGSGGSEQEGSDTATPSGPVCGDAVMEGDETCDDGNAIAGDGCQKCARDSVVFISSEVYQGFALEGLYGADQRCRSLAAKAGLANFETFRAWLSSSTRSVDERLLHSEGRYVRVDGQVVAENWEGLTSGSLKNTMNVDEKGGLHFDRVWTGTHSSGLPALGSEFCGDWDDNTGLLIHGGEGRSVVVDDNWSFIEHGGCGSESHIYCFEQ